MQRLIRLQEVLDLVGLKKTALYDRMEVGAFPKPVKLSDDGRAVAWVEQEVEDWITERIKARDSE